MFPLLFALGDGIETIVTGLCVETTYGFGMPEGDSVIIIGVEYAVFAFAFWLYILWREGRPYNPFTRHSAPRLLGAVADNVGIVMYAYTMAIDSVSTDPIVATYPILVMLGGRLLMGERLGAARYALLLGIVSGSVLIVLGTI